MWLFRVLTAAISAAVAATCAKIGFVLVDGRYRTLIPAVFGFLYHASVRLEFHVGASERVSTNRSLGDMTSVLQLRDACVYPAAGDMTSMSIEVGLVMVFCTPTIAWKSVSLLLSHLRSASM